jgi:hypothetical protein
MTNPITAKIDILKISICGKVSAPSDHTLTYNIGYDTGVRLLNEWRSNCQWQRPLDGLYFD